MKRRSFITKSLLGLIGIVLLPNGNKTVIMRTPYVDYDKGNNYWMEMIIYNDGSRIRRRFNRKQKITRSYLFPTL